MIKYNYSKERIVIFFMETKQIIEELEEKYKANNYNRSSK